MSSKPDFFPTRAHVLLCTGPKCSSRVRGLFASLWQALEQEQLAYYAKGGTVRLTESSCLGACNYGPNLTCYVNTDSGIEEAWYFDQDLASALDIARAIQRGEPLPTRKRYDR